MKNWISSILICFCGITAIQGDQVSDRTLDQQELKKYRSDPDFDYSKSRVQSGSLLTLILATLVDKVLTFFDNSGIGWLGPWLFRVLVILILVTVLFFIIRNRYGPIFFKETSFSRSGGFISSGVQREDYDRLLQQSLNAEHYKLAIRYLFLRSLQRLDAKGVLRIEQWKAPYDYLNELPEVQKAPFKLLIDLFEETWYGEHHADVSTYQQGEKVSKELIAE